MINQIGKTNLYIGCYPFLIRTKEKFDLLIDLTSEFPPCKNIASSYICLPNLDGVALKNRGWDEKKWENKKILIHCAQGHGRSRTFAAIVLLKTDVAHTAKEAIQIIQSSRPKARLASTQMKQLMDLYSE